MLYTVSLGIRVQCTPGGCWKALTCSQMETSNKSARVETAAVLIAHVLMTRRDKYIAIMIIHVFGEILQYAP